MSVKTSWSETFVDGRGVLELQDTTSSAGRADATGHGSDGGSQRAVVAAFRGHHAELAEHLAVRTTAMLAAARTGECDEAREYLHDWYSTALIPHIVAEEQALYACAAELDATRLLICGLLVEHRTLMTLIAGLALSRDPFDAAMTAASVQALFAMHLAKEDDLLLPALDAGGLDLPEILTGTQGVLGAAEAAEEGGCGCGHDHSSDGAGDAKLVRITSAPDQTAPALTSVPTAGPEELDVRALPHGQRHEIIFARLDALSAGQALVIVNDHDPKPLRYQTEGMWPGRFDWSYSQAGPEVWRVAIRRAI